MTWFRKQWIDEMWWVPATLGLFVVAIFVFGFWSSTRPPRCYDDNVYWFVHDCAEHRYVDDCKADVPKLYPACKVPP